MDEKNTSSFKYKTIGVYNRVNDTQLRITELPVGRWTFEFKKHLDILEANDIIYKYDNYSDDEKVNFRVKFKKEQINNYDIDKLIKLFKLSENINITNMHAFGVDGKIKKYDSPEEIIWDFY